MTADRVGIEAMHTYAGVAYIAMEDLFTGRGLDRSRMDNLGMTERSVGLPFEDPVTNAVNAALPLVAQLTEQDRARIECLVVTTESGLDLSKSVTSYVHQFLGLSRQCRMLEVKQACYSATGSLQLVAGLLASGMASDAKALLIGTDVTLVDERAQYAEGCTGHGAVAMVVSTDNPTVLALDPGAYGNYGYEVLDSARPTPTTDIANPDESLFTYLDCLEQSFDDYCSRVAGADLRTTFGQLAFHTPFAGLVKAGHRNLMRRAGASAAEIAEDFHCRLGAGLTYPRRTGNLCSASVFLALASIIENADLEAATRVGLYSYGSGCCSEFFSGVIAADAPQHLAGDLGAALDARRRLDWGEYLSLLKESSSVLEPIERRQVDLTHTDVVGNRTGRQPFLAWTGTDAHKRTYDWL
jgi:polyketide biosynthesis 3-hydroxy-3-methylglutaryl-CoA synthase-like enzyme PksG